MTATLRSAEFQRKAGIAAGIAWLVSMAGLTLAACLSGGCGASALQVHAGVADIAGQTITASGEQLLEQRARDLRAAVEEAPARDVAVAGVQVVQSRYAPAVAAYDALRLTHDAYVETLVLAAAGDLDDVARWASTSSTRLPSCSCSRRLLEVRHDAVGVSRRYQQHRAERLVRGAARRRA